MENTILQVPLSKNLRDEALSASVDYGFSSLQELIRVFLNKIAKKEISFTISDRSEVLSSNAVKRYNKLISDVEKGKGVTKTSGVDELMSLLIK